MKTDGTSIIRVDNVRQIEQDPVKTNGSRKLVENVRVCDTRADKGRITWTMAIIHELETKLTKVLTSIATTLKTDPFSIA